MADRTGPAVLRALSIRQPWADAILYGDKRVENRTWATPAAVVGTRVLLHASRLADPDALPPEMTRDWPDHHGALVGVARLDGCHRARGCCHPWGEPGVWHWQLSDVHALAAPVPCPGRLGLWTPPPPALTTLADTARIPARAVRR